jgi:hypothetical protein
VSRYHRALWIEHRRHDARQLVDNRWREHRVGECVASNVTDAQVQQRLAVNAALQDRCDARAPRRAAPAEHVHQRRRQVKLAPAHSCCRSSARAPSRQATQRCVSTRFATKRSAAAAAILTPTMSSPSLKPRAHSGNSNDLLVVLVVQRRHAVGARHQVRIDSESSQTSSSLAALYHLFRSMLNGHD